MHDFDSKPAQDLYNTHYKLHQTGPTSGFTQEPKVFHPNVFGGATGAGLVDARERKKDFF